MSALSVTMTAITAHRAVSRDRWQQLEADLEECKERNEELTKEVEALRRELRDLKAENFRLMSELLGPSKRSTLR